MMKWWKIASSIVAGAIVLSVVALFYSIPLNPSRQGQGDLSTTSVEPPLELEKLADYVDRSDRIMTGMVTDKEVFGNEEYVWISVYEWLKKGDSTMGQIILRVGGSPPVSELQLDIGEEVLLMLEDIDVQNGYFGLFHLGSDKPSKYPLALRDEILSLVEKSEQNKTREQKEDEELQRLLNQSGNGNCSIMEVESAGGRTDKFFYCTYDDREMRFYVPISETLKHVKQQLLKDVSEEYFNEHFNLKRAWDMAVVNGKAVPERQTMEFEYVLGNFTFLYMAHVRLGFEENDSHLLYLEYFPPREITDIAIEDKNQVEEIIYNSSCLTKGTPYVLTDIVATAHVDRGFSPIISGYGPPNVFDRSGNQITEAESRFRVWVETGEIECTSNVKYSDGIDRNVARIEQIVLMDASDYVSKH